MREKGVTTITLKKINKEKVYQYIYKEKQTSKQQIVQNLQMGLSTVSQNLTLLEQEGMIRRDGYFESTGGRKAQVIQIVADYRIAIGIGLLKNMFHIVATDLYGETMAVDTISVPYENTPAYYSQVAASVEEFILKNHYNTDSILGVSIATQGVISPDGSHVTYGAIMNNAAMKLSDFSSRIPYACHLEHDSKSAAALELWSHSDLDSAVVFLLNRNLGGAVITGRQVHQGSTMHSGTVEHMCINPEGPLCYCGNRGCLETYCSANSLEAAAEMPVKEFFDHLRNESAPELQNIWNDYLNHLAFAIKNLNMIIDSPVIISGYLAPYFIPEDLDHLLTQINSGNPFSFASDQLILGTHGQYTPAVGAALHYVKKFLKSSF